MKDVKASGPTVVLLNARLIDPAGGRDEPGGLLIRDGLIADLGAHLRRSAPDGAEIIDCRNNVVCPGLIDMQVFTGEPGYEYRETLKSASRAAAAGGITTMVVMPNTEPVIDSVALVDFIERRARDTALVKVHPMAAMTKALAGQEMAEIGLLKAAGAVAVTNGKHSVTSARIMRNVLSYAKDFGALVVHHVEEPSLTEGGTMNAGEVATRLGLPAMPKAAELIMLERDIRLVELTGGRYHAANISCAESLDIIRKAKARGLPVTCGVSINHLTLNENDIGSYRTYLRLRPPLRSEDDRMALVRGLEAGEIDVVVSSHDPKDADVKRRPFAEAADGAVGLETLLAALLRLHHSPGIPLPALLKPLTINPATLLGLPSGRLAKGAPADITLLDLGQPWVVDKNELRSKSKNTPFDEAKMQGRVLRTIVNGRTVFPLSVRTAAGLGEREAVR